MDLTQCVSSPPCTGEALGLWIHLSGIMMRLKMLLPAFNVTENTTNKHKHD